MVEKFPTVLEKLSQHLRGDFFDSHCIWTMTTKRADSCNASALGRSKLRYYFSRYCKNGNSTYFLWTRVYLVTSVNGRVNLIAGTALRLCLPTGVWSEPSYRGCTSEQRKLLNDQVCQVYPHQSNQSTCRCCCFYCSQSP